MSVCNECHRPISPQWHVCGWCGTERVQPNAQARMFAGLLNMLLAFQAIALVGGTIALAVSWAIRGWSVEQGQTLGIIWLGVMMALALTAWLSVNLNNRESIEGGAGANAPQTS